MYMKKGKNGREDFEELNFEAEPKRWFAELFKLAIQIWKEL